MVPSPRTVAPKHFILPDLVSHCNFKLRISRHRKQVTSETKKWLFQGDNLSGDKRKAYHGLNAGLLTAMTYPDAACPQLRVCNDFLTFLFHLDNLSDDMDNRGTRSVADVVLNSLYHPHTFRPSARIGRMTRHLYKRIIQTAFPGAQQRFIETMDFFFQSVTQQALDRANGVIPDLESYIALRRDTSGCKPCWALIEYANNLNIPDDVMDHPTIRALGEATNDLVTWSNDIFSYNVEQSKGDTHNMIVVAMNQKGLDLQAAVDFVGDMCKQSIDRFTAERANLPSWGPAIDRQVQAYVNGLADWIVGSLHWSFESTRYFGTNGRKIKAARVVELLPLRPGAIQPTLESTYKSKKALSICATSVLPSQPLEPSPVATSPPVTPKEEQHLALEILDPDGITSKGLVEDHLDESIPPILRVDIFPKKNNSTPVLGRIQTIGLPVFAEDHDPDSTISTGVLVFHPLSPDILSPAGGNPLAPQRAPRNGDGQMANPFMSLYALTLWVFYSLIIQPSINFYRSFVDGDVHAHPFIF